MANTMIGRIVSIGQTVNVSKEKEFLKRELVLDCSRFDEYTGEKRENYVVFSFTQKRCEELDGYHAGDLVEVSFIITGRKYEKDGKTRFINDVVGYKVERKQQSPKASEPQAPQAPQAPQMPQAAPQPVPQQAPQYSPEGDPLPPSSELPF